MVEGVLLRSSSIISQDQSFVHFLHIFVINYELLGWATGWATRLAHGLTQWASGLSMGLNNNRPGRPLAGGPSSFWVGLWAVGYLMTLKLSFHVFKGGKIISHYGKNHIKLGLDRRFCHFKI